MICESGETTGEAIGSGFSYTKSGLMYTGPGDESPLENSKMETKKKKDIKIILCFNIRSKYFYEQNICNLFFPISRVKKDQTM